ncbi:Methyltransferase type 11 [Neofusicoccum parvum]|uniref:Methyltransferase type 11 n=1 Tax=Neofusicoccum parvum TaxID=310453 RepID=A0ACB5SQD1_9PEZI|nr:Methyltransferase type 11 [Neofusicoccum parvum]
MAQDVQYIEVDTSAEQADEAYAESSASSALTSLASEIRRGIQENGRTYASYGSHEYGLPVDERELDRQDLQHHKFVLAQGDKLFLAPLTEIVQNVLDIGTGTGIWCIDMADRFPSAHITGTDIAPVQPTWVPPNCNFIIEDCETNWQFHKESFDFIHSRDCYTSVRDWPRFMKQTSDHLKPGGWAELACSTPTVHSDDDSLPADSAIVEFSETMKKIGNAFDADLETPHRYAEWMKEAGFVNVTERKIKIPLSEWPKDKNLKKVGVLERLNLIEGAESFMLRGFTEKLQRPREEMELLLMRMRKELMANKYHGYIFFVVACGQKPRIVGS